MNEMHFFVSIVDKGTVKFYILQIWYKVSIFFRCKLLQALICSKKVIN